MLTLSLAAGVPPGIIGLAVNAVNKYIFVIKYCILQNILSYYNL